ncbi:MAG TPA: BBE domain-containing protein, partial [Gemmatimonadaceae bacterium]
SDPACALPKAPTSVVTIKAEWDWDEIDERSFSTLVRNFGTWHERNGDEHSMYAAMFSVLIAGCRQPGRKIALRALSIAGEGGERQLDEHIAAISDGVSIVHTRRVEEMSWLTFALTPFPDLFFVAPGGTSVSQARLKAKDALLRAAHTDRQMAVMYRYLTQADVSVFGFIGLASYGGRVNSVRSDATASAQRSSVMDTAYSVGWMNADDEARSVAWVREFYRDVFADSGGVPVPGASTEGALINHPDVDLADPEWNTSGVPWHTMYYNDNYVRLQAVKAQYDPRNVFHHALSIQLPRDGTMGS